MKRSEVKVDYQLISYKYVDNHATKSLIVILKFISISDNIIHMPYFTYINCPGLAFYLLVATLYIHS